MGVVRLWVHGIYHCWLMCGEILKSFEGLKLEGGTGNEKSLWWVNWEWWGLKLWELCNEFLLVRLRRSAGQKMLWSLGGCINSWHTNWTTMSIKLTSFRGNWFVHAGNRQAYYAKKVNYDELLSKLIAAEILPSNSEANVSHYMNAKRL